MNSIIGTDEIGDVIVISTQGYLNKDLGEEIFALVEKNISNGKKKFIINLAQSDIVNSIGASIMIEIIEELQEADGTLAFCTLAPIVEKTFTIMGLTKYCSTFKSQEAALEHMA